MNDPIQKASQLASKATEEATKAEQKIEQKLTVLWHEIEAWQQDNHYIHSGYRPQSSSYSKSAKSLGYLHNETVNIYSHLLGAIVAVVGGLLLYFTIKPRYELASSEDVFVFSCYFVGVITCLSMSATYHTISNHSLPVAKFGNALDYFGIVFLIWGSYVPCLYYGFQQNERLMKVYTAMISTNCLATAMLTLLPHFRAPSWRPIRAGMFVVTGLSGVVPVVHALRLYGYAQMDEWMGLSWVLAQGAMYIVGAGLYAARVPERFAPGAFDIWGSSHQIFHLFVLAAAGTHFVGMVKTFDYWHSIRGEYPPIALFKDW